MGVGNMSPEFAGKITLGGTAGASPAEEYALGNLVPDYGKLGLTQNQVFAAQKGDFSGLSQTQMQSMMDFYQGKLPGAQGANIGGGKVPGAGENAGTPSLAQNYSNDVLARLNTQIESLQKAMGQQPGSMGGATNTLPGTNPVQLTPNTGGVNTQPGLLPSAPLTVTNPAGGIVGGNTPSGKDEASLLSEAELQKQLAQQTNTGLVDTRSQNLSSLADLITKQQQRLISQNMPGVYEDLNTRGLLRSSELGNAVSRQQAIAAANLQDTIGQQGISDSNTNLNNLQGIENNYLGNRSAAIQRGMSLQDWQRQVEASRSLGFAMQPQQPQGNGKSSSPLTGALGGASVGSKFGPTGAAVGGAAGLLAGQGK